MTKLIKMSLAAAVAVAGLSSTATAGSLADAVKDTTISGKVEVGFNTAETKKSGSTATTENEWEYDIDMTLNTKVNDMITSQVGFQADHTTDVRNESTDTNGGQSITLTKMNFTAKTDVATVIVGKQKQPTPFLDDERGDGVVALVPAGPVTLAAGHFTGMVGGGNGTDGSAVALDLSQRDINALAVIAAAGPVNVQAWYLAASGNGSTATQNLESGLSGYSLNVAGKFGPVSVDFNHASLELDADAGSSFDSEDLTKVAASMSMDALTVNAAFAMTNDAKQGRLHGVDLSKDNDAATNVETEHFAMDDLNDATAYLVGASFAMGQTTVGGHFFMADQDKANTDYTEIALNASYAMSKNFKVSAVYATSEIDTSTTDTDKDSFEVSMKYSF